MTTPGLLTSLTTLGQHLPHSKCQEAKQQTEVGTTTSACPETKRSETALPHSPGSSAENSNSLPALTTGADRSWLFGEVGQAD